MGAQKHRDEMRGYQQPAGGPHNQVRLPFLQVNVEEEHCKQEGARQRYQGARVELAQQLSASSLIWGLRREYQKTGSLPATCRVEFRGGQRLETVWQTAWGQQELTQKATSD